MKLIEEGECNITKILVPSASHVLTDHLLSSEGVSCYNIFKQLQNFGYKFEVLSAKVDINKPLNNITTYETGFLETSPTSTTIRKYLNHLEILRRNNRISKKIIQKQKIDIVHHMLPAVYNQTFNLARICKKFSQPFVFGPISVHFFPRPLDEKIFSKITSKLHEKTIQNCDCLITITDQVKKIYSQFFDETKIWTIPLGVDTKKFTPLKEETQKKSFEILFAGYLYRLKGVEYLLKAISEVVKEHENVTLRIVGDGPEKNHLMKLAEKLKIGNKIVFEGLIAHPEMPRFYQNCDIFCFPTLGEPFGKSIIEAMACAKPVIASNIGGPVEIIQDGVTGFLIPPAEPEAIATKINELADNPKKVKQLGLNSRKIIKEKYSWNKIALSYNKVYEKLL